MGRCRREMNQTPTNNLPRIVLVDDHPAVLRQTVQLLSKHFEIVAALPDGGKLLSLAKDKVDLVVLDITLPEVSGIEWAARLREAGFRGKVVFLTVHADADYAREALDAGACGYVIKPRLASDLLPALRAALAGEHFISPCPELREFV